MEPWTEKFKPNSLQEIVGNYNAALELLEWIKSYLSGKTDKKAVLLYGPPGTGKTLSVHLIAKTLDLELLEMNASDFRTEEIIESIAGSASLQSSLFGKKGKIILFDEVDGISGKEDRGGINAIKKIINTSRYPVVLIANNPWDPKLRELRELCHMIRFNRIRTPSIVARLKRIAQLAGINAEEEALKRIAEVANGDMRAAINDFQMLSQGKKYLREGDVVKLYPRTQELEIFEVMKGIFSANTILKAKITAENSAIDIDLLMQWINENIPNQYTTPEERAEAYDWFSKADVFLNRAKRKQMWDLMSYAIELAVGGVALAKRTPYKFTKYSFPRIISLLSQNKEEREKRREELKALAKELHVSTRKLISEYLPYINIIHNKEL
ncbi:MAG: replication factor C large subunit [Candidatus Methanomethylicota archaeon]|jgi:replication factor C large subunit|uniref:Replication factor C large subunit n=1 Tax=Thermoproteota archaeon TaxID=2056631 RepID=A0A523BE94_9CREN|nr:MAG: replication factor C large subunit [Candidatus Verstraetearchaeota archaeon]TDA39235.1 MAG: replication factor C large subunit [Candidatus Verstraetearchaeota archaeon]